MFFYDGVMSNMSCGLKVDSSCKSWYQTTSKILMKIKGLSYEFDTKQGMIYISGKVDPQKILKMIAKHGNNVELCWIKTGEQYGSGNNYAMHPYGTTASRSMSISSYAPYHRGYCPPPPPPPVPYNQFHNYEHYSAPPLYPPPQLPYYH